METKDLNRLIKVNLNPYTIVRLIALNTEEELEEIEQNTSGLDIDSKLVDNFVEIEVSPIEAILFISKNDLITVNKELTSVGIKFKMTNIINEFFEMDNLNELLLKLEGDDDLDESEKELVKDFFPNFKTPREKAISIIKSVFENNFTMDDVLDRINSKGIDSLNEFHKNILI
jgi:hypothetical protein